MKWQDMIWEAFNRQGRELEKVVDGLTVEDLNKQPAPDTNPIGWMVWHVIRSYDRNMSEAMGEEQLWIKEKWHAKFGRPADPGETGYGHTAEQVKAFKSPPANVIIEYSRAILKKIENYINTKLTEEELNRQNYSPTFKKSYPLGERIISQFWHGAHQIGQADYVRGLLKGTGKGVGWYGR